MIQRERLQQFSFFLFYAGLMVLVVSMPLSKFGMSVSQFMIAAGWVMSGDFMNKFRKFLSSKIALAIVSVYFMHLIGLLYTTDFHYAFKDLRIKLPLLVLPLLLSTAPKLSPKQFENVLLAAIGGVTVSTLVSFLVYAGIINRPVIDIRDISIFISHIRLSLLCCLSVFIAAWLIFQHRKDENLKRYVFVLVPIIIWLFYFLVLIQSLTGIVILGSVICISFIYLLFKKGSTKLKVAMFFSIALLVSYFSYKVNRVMEVFAIKEKIENIDTLSLTPSGNVYINFTDRLEYENGYPVWAYVCEPEMEQLWNKRSNLDYASKDKRNQDLRFTLIRFLTSKGLRKDSSGVAALTVKEIAAIENGIANVYYIESGQISARIHEVVWELQNVGNGHNPSGHSIAQRFEYWKTAAHIIKENPLLGVGTGDVPASFNRQYELMNSPLSKEWRLRAHNQYLSIAVAYGLIGLVWFIMVLFYLLIISFKRGDLLFISFALIAMISMLSEDTLETQAGVTFFTLFACLFLFVNPQNSSVGGNPK